LGNGTPVSVSKRRLNSGDKITNPAGENRLVVDVTLNPSH
jgi:hypothetical protein